MATEAQMRMPKRGKAAGAEPASPASEGAASRTPSFVEMPSVTGSPLFEEEDAERASGAPSERPLSFRSSFDVTRGASLLSCVVNLTNTIVGAGMLGLPKAFANCGSLLGAFLLVVFAGASIFGLHLLSSAAALVRAKSDAPASFRSVATAAAPKFASVIDLAVAIKCFGVATSYLVVVGQMVPHVVPEGYGLLERREPWILGAAALVAPVAFLKNLDSLKITSMLSLGFVLFLTVIIVTYSFHPTGSEDRGTTKRVILDMNTAKTISIFIFGYTCHQNIFAVVNEIARPTQRRVDTVALSAVGAAAGVYLAVAWCGYASFGDTVDGDVLENYPKTVVITCARGFVALLVLPSYPLQLFPSRQCMLTLLDALAPAEGGAETATAARRHVAVTAGFLMASLAVALAVDDLSTILAVVGATGSTAVTYILPGGIFYVLAPPSRKRYFAFAHFAFGCCVVPAALTMIFI